MMAGAQSQSRASSARLGTTSPPPATTILSLWDLCPTLFRDPFSTISTGVSIHKMHTATRNRETLFGNSSSSTTPTTAPPRWYDRGETSSLEGGDILILSPQVLAVGISQSTQEDSIDQLAETVLSQSKTFRKLLAFDIPKTRSFMHLDTVFTMVDYDKFTVHPNILQQITVFVMELDENRRMTIRQEDGRLEDILKEHLELDRVQLIPCGQGSEIDNLFPREQWSDGSKAPWPSPTARWWSIPGTTSATAPWRRRASGSTPSPARS